MLGFKGQPMKAVAVPIRPYSCVLCCQLCALPSLSCNEKRDLGAEWTMYKQSHVEQEYNMCRLSSEPPEVTD